MLEASLKYTNYFIVFGLADDLPEDNTDNWFNADNATVPHFDSNEDLAAATYAASMVTENIVFEDSDKTKTPLSGDAKKTTSKSVVHQETKADYPARLVYPPLNPGMPDPTKPEFHYSDEDPDNDGAVLRVEDDQYTFVALLE